MKQTIKEKIGFDLLSLSDYELNKALGLCIIDNNTKFWTLEKAAMRKRKIDYFELLKNESTVTRRTILPILAANLPDEALKIVFNMPIEFGGAFYEEIFKKAYSEKYYTFFSSYMYNDYQFNPPDDYLKPLRKVFFRHFIWTAGYEDQERQITWFYFLGRYYKGEPATTFLPEKTNPLLSSMNMDNWSVMACAEAILRGRVDKYLNDLFADKTREYKAFLPSAWKSVVFYVEQNLNETQILQAVILAKIMEANGTKVAMFMQKEIADKFGFSAPIEIKYDVVFYFKISNGLFKVAFGSNKIELQDNFKQTIQKFFAGILDTAHYEDIELFFKEKRNVLHRIFNFNIFEYWRSR